MSTINTSTMNTDLECIFKSHDPLYWLSCYVYVKAPGFKRAIFGFNIMELKGKNFKRWLEQRSKKYACNHGPIEEFSFNFIYITKLKCSWYDDHVGMNYQLNVKRNNLFKEKNFSLNNFCELISMIFAES